MQLRSCLLLVGLLTTFVKTSPIDDGLHRRDDNTESEVTPKEDASDTGDTFYPPNTPPYPLPKPPPVPGRSFGQCCTARCGVCLSGSCDFNEECETGLYRRCCIFWSKRDEEGISPNPNYDVIPTEY